MSKAKPATGRKSGSGITPRWHPLARNPNKHTARGTGMLADAMSRHGYVAPMTAAANGAILDGNLRLETAATVFAEADPLVVEHDGTRPIVMVRTDIASEHDPRAKDIIVSANRIAEVDLAYDLDVLREYQAEGLDLRPFEFEAQMLAEMTGTGPSLEDPSFQQARKIRIAVTCEAAHRPAVMDGLARLSQSVPSMTYYAD